MHASSILRLILSALVVQAFASALSAEDLDLAKQDAGDVITLPVSAGRVPIRVLNRVPTREYAVSVVREVRSIPELQPIARRVLPADICQQLLIKAQSLRTPPLAEADVSRIVKEVRDDLKKCDDAAVRTKILEELEGTVIDLGEYELPPGSQLTITVSRKDDSGNTLTWVKVLQTEERGRWLTLYGLGVVPSRDDRYFLTPAGEGKFTIEQEDKRRGYKAVPSVFFMWLPRKRQTSDLSHGFTAGFGVKNDQPALSAGYSVLFNWNLGLVAGVSLVRELRLNGRYKSPQEVTENLSEDALHSKVLQTRAMVALVFRFGSNPFTSADEGGAKKEPTKTKPGDEAKGK